MKQRKKKRKKQYTSRNTSRRTKKKKNNKERRWTKNVRGLHAVVSFSPSCVVGEGRPHPFYFFWRGGKHCPFSAPSSGWMDVSPMGVEWVGIY